LESGNNNGTQLSQEASSQTTQVSIEELVQGMRSDKFPEVIAAFSKLYELRGRSVADFASLSDTIRADNPELFEKFVEYCDLRERAEDGDFELLYSKYEEQVAERGTRDGVALMVFKSLSPDVKTVFLDYCDERENLKSYTDNGYYAPLFEAMTADNDTIWHAVYDGMTEEQRNAFNEYIDSVERT
jgi:hypothetical protein